MNTESVTTEEAIEGEVTHEASNSKIVKIERLSKEEMMFERMKYGEYEEPHNDLEVYTRGEKALSRWKKEDFISEVNDINPDKVGLIEKVPNDVLKDKLLVPSAIHLTSKKNNPTQFYIVAKKIVESIDLKVVDSWMAEHKMELQKEKNKQPVKYYGNFSYTVYMSDIIDHHKVPIKYKLKGVLIEERGCFYYVYNEDGDLIVKKKIGSNGTHASKLPDLKDMHEISEWTKEDILSKIKETYPEKVDLISDLPEKLLFEKVLTSVKVGRRILYKFCDTKVSNICPDTVAKWISGSKDKRKKHHKKHHKNKSINNT